MGKAFCFGCGSYDDRCQSSAGCRRRRDQRLFEPQILHRPLGTRAPEAARAYAELALERIRRELGCLPGDELSAVRDLRASRDNLRYQIEAKPAGLEARNQALGETADLLGVLYPERFFDVPGAVRRLIDARDRFADRTVTLRQRLNAVMAAAEEPYDPAAECYDDSYDADDEEETP